MFLYRFTLCNLMKSIIYSVQKKFNYVFILDFSNIQTISDTRYMYTRTQALQVFNLIQVNGLPFNNYTVIEVASSCIVHTHNKCWNTVNLMSNNLYIS